MLQFPQFWRYYTVPKRIWKPYQFYTKKVKWVISIGATVFLLYDLEPKKTWNGHLRPRLGPILTTGAQHMGPRKKHKIQKVFIFQLWNF